MLIKTVVNENEQGAELYKSYCKTNAAQDFLEFKLSLAEKEYDDNFTEALSQEIANYYMHSVFIYDYESSSDAGDGREDYSKEENDVQISLDACIIKDNTLFGVMCEAFGEKRFLLLDYPETNISHPRNYGGRNYHFYRDQSFTLIKKDI